MRGWSRELWYDETGLEWIAPSPNLRSLAAAALYPGIGLLETTNVSVGRGHRHAVRDRRRAVARRRAPRARTRRPRNLPGVRFTPVHFTPGRRRSSPASAAAACGSTVTDRERAAPRRARHRDRRGPARPLSGTGTVEARRPPRQPEGVRALRGRGARRAHRRLLGRRLEAFRRRAAAYRLYGAVTPR